MIRAIFALMAFVLTSLVSIGQEISYISLKNEKAKYSPKQFYIDSVLSNTEVGDTVAVVSQGHGQKKYIVFKNGLTNALGAYVTNNTSQDQSKSPLHLKITSFDVAMKKSGSRWVSDLSIRYAFYAGPDRVYEAGVTGREESSQFTADYIELFMRNALEQSMKQFDDRWNEHKNSTVIDEQVKVNVILATTSDNNDHIIYSLARPLSIDDFRGSANDNHGPEMAMTASGIGMEIKNHVQEGHLVTTVTLTPYFSVNDSWFKQEGKNPRILAHEQTHFDITALKACEFAKAIRAATFTKENLVARLKEMEEQNAADSRKEEDDYDNETNHSIITDKELEWEKKIKEQLQACSCY